ncbi:MAG TPA: glycosyltransferase [Tepidisphaeraceae bacterium]|jgi:glycosyltransferase involved in cell wall biosynthesis|nr:glycosyltransferase [Tepidisphaeraceae bacterium]
MQQTVATIHKLSVIIPAFNEEAGIGECVRRVRAALDQVASLLADDEIVVCDNNSTDRTSAIAAELGCKIVFEPVNQIARARNTGARSASGEWLLFVDADSWPSGELLRDAIQTMNQQKHIGCGSTIRIIDGPRWFKWAWESKNLSMRLLKWCPGGFIMCRRDAFEAVGGFPEDYYIFEEAVFIRLLKQQAKRQGLKFTVLHKHPFSASGRKGTEFGFWSWLKTALQLWRSPRTLVKDKSFARKWYETRRSFSSDK